MNTKSNPQANGVAVRCIGLVDAEAKERRAWRLFEMESRRLSDEIEERYAEITKLEEAWADTYAEVKRLQSQQASTVASEGHLPAGQTHNQPQEPRG
jgi:Skp family chaperone for outer membrane proteins